MKKYILLLMSGILMSCASIHTGTQNLSKEVIQQKIIIAKTTKNELLKIFGTPKSVLTESSSQVVSNNSLSKVEGKECWQYFRGDHESVLFVGSTTMLLLKVCFDKDGNVLDYVITESSK
jgi:hypothetical protein